MIEKLHSESDEERQVKLPVRFREDTTYHLHDTTVARSGSRKEAYFCHQLSIINIFERQRRERTNDLITTSFLLLRVAVNIIAACYNREVVINTSVLSSVYYSAALSVIPSTSGEPYDSITAAVTNFFHFFGFDPSVKTKICNTKHTIYRGEGRCYSFNQRLCFPKCRRTHQQQQQQHHYQ